MTMNAAIDTEALAAEAAAAIRAMLAVRDPQMAGYWEAERKAAKAVTKAITAGASHREIAVSVGCDGLTVIHLIQDVNARTEAFAAERHHAERYVATVKEATASHARQVIGAAGGKGKSTLADKLGISRPTLDAWIADDDE